MLEPDTSALLHSFLPFGLVKTFFPLLTLHIPCDPLHVFGLQEASESDTTLFRRLFSFHDSHDTILQSTHWNVTAHAAHTLHLSWTHPHAPTHTLPPSRCEQVFHRLIDPRSRLIGHTSRGIFQRQEPGNLTAWNLAQYWTVRENANTKHANSPVRECPETFRAREYAATHHGAVVSLAKTQYHAFRPLAVAV